ncbi:hypothetical protein VTK26DRAFT_2008 [Humicola hyalothermophila]
MQQLQQRAAASAARPLARSALAARSTPLSSGAIAGAVIGSVAGALLIALCLFPFIVRARRRWLARHDVPSLTEMGQSPGGPIASPHVDPSDDSSKRCSKDHLPPRSESGLENATARDHPPADVDGSVTISGHELAPTVAPDQQSHRPAVSQQGATSQPGLPSPDTPSISPTSRTAATTLGDGPTASPVAASPPGQSPRDSLSQSRYESKGTVGRESARELSLSDSQGPPSRQLTAFTSAGITEEPESFDQASDSPDQGHFSNLRESLRGLIHRRRSSQQRGDSKRSFTGSGSDGARSPSSITNQVIPQAAPPPSSLEIDPDTRGLAWDYYNDPTLGVELSGTYAQSAPIGTSSAIAQPTHAPTSDPSGPVFPTDQSSVPPVVTGPAFGETGIVSLDSDKTPTPTTFSRQGTFVRPGHPAGPLQRTDSLPPPTIVADIPSLPQFQYNIGPSGNPMEMMRPTNQAESAWMLEHEMKKIQNSPPPPPTFDSDPSMSLAMSASMPMPMPMPMAEAPCAMPNANSKMMGYQPHYQNPYQSPPPAIEVEMAAQENLTAYDDPNMLTSPDYSTPPPSTGPSMENTPDTRLTPYTASPSPPSDMDAVNNVQLAVSPGPSAAMSPGMSAGTSPGLSPAPSPSPSPGRTSGPYTCLDCGTVKNTLYEFNHHQRYHKRPFPCTHPGCDKSFGTITHLKRHINDRHDKTRKFYCTQPDCPWSRRGGKSFPRKDNWRRHMKNKHQIDPDNGPDAEYAGEVAMAGT